MSKTRKKIDWTIRTFSQCGEVYEPRKFTPVKCLPKEIENVSVNEIETKVERKEL